MSQIEELLTTINLFLLLQATNTLLNAIQLYPIYPQVVSVPLSQRQIQAGSNVYYSTSTKELQT